MGEERGVYFEEHNITQKHIVSRIIVALSVNRPGNSTNRVRCQRNEVWNYFWN